MGEEWVRRRRGDKIKGLPKATAGGGVCEGRGETKREILNEHLSVSNKSASSSSVGRSLPFGEGYIV